MQTVVIALLTLTAPPSDDWISFYDEGSLTYTGGKYEDEVFHYRLLKPQKIARGRKYPIILFLHGKDDRGDDNRGQLEFPMKLLAQPQHRQKYPCFVIAPQCRDDEFWMSFNPDQPSDAMRVAMAIVDQVLETEPADPRRVYLTGLSMGGFGAWEAATRWPERFAAVAPICGGGDVSRAERLVDVPIWAFHGAADDVVPVSQTTDMIAAIRDAGGKPKLTVLKGVGHASWVPVYNDPQGVIPWMFKQVNNRRIGKEGETHSKH
jgi:predicted peptidase